MFSSFFITIVQVDDAGIKRILGILYFHQEGFAKADKWKNSVSYKSTLSEGQ